MNISYIENINLEVKEKKVVDRKFWDRDKDNTIISFYNDHIKKNGDDYIKNKWVMIHKSLIIEHPTFDRTPDQIRKHICYLKEKNDKRILD